MATTLIKKKTVVTPVKKVTIAEPVEKQVYPHYMSSNSNDEFLSLFKLLEDEECGISEDETSWNITKCLSESFRIDLGFSVNATEHTCGFMELGELSVNKMKTPAQVLELAKFLDEIVQNAKGYTLFMNTNGEGSCATLEGALPKCKNWTMVKKYRNPSTGRLLTLWVSNN